MTPDIEKQSDAEAVVDTTLSQNSQKNDLETPKPIPELKVKQWSSNYEFILMSIACKSMPPHYNFFDRREIETAPNMFQIFLCYIFVGIPVSYMQIILGQYSQRGVFFIKYMLPILKGVILLAVFALFWGWVATMLMVEQYILYIMLSCGHQPFMWMKCDRAHQSICFEALKPCRVKPCLDQDRHLAAYVYWNVTFMGGISGEENVSMALPELWRVWALVLAWIVVYLISSRSFEKAKKVIIYLVHLYLICNFILFLVLAGFNNLDETLKMMFRTPMESLYNFYSWSAALAVTSVDLNLGDSTSIMLGVHTPTKSQTGALSGINGLVIYILHVFKSLMLCGAMVWLKHKAGIVDEDIYLLFQPRIKNINLGVIPTFLGTTGYWARSWTIMYFFWLIIGVIQKVVIEMQLLYMSIYACHHQLISYHTYITPVICLLGFTCGLLFESKESFAVYQEVLLKVRKLCCNTNSFILAVFVFYIYGMARFEDDVHFMSGQAPTIFWRITWAISPICLIWAIPVVFYGNHYYHKYIAIAVVFIFTPIVLMSSYDVFKTVLNKNIWSLFRPDRRWGPVDAVQNEMRHIFNPRQQTRYTMKKYSLPCKHNCLLKNKFLNKIILEEEAAQRALHFGDIRQLSMI